jgi:hypothetical protein
VRPRAFNLAGGGSKSVSLLMCFATVALWAWSYCHFFFHSFDQSGKGWHVSVTGGGISVGN